MERTANIDLFSEQAYTCREFTTEAIEVVY